MLWSISNWGCTNLLIFYSTTFATKKWARLNSGTLHKLYKLVELVYRVTVFDQLLCGSSTLLSWAFEDTEL